MAREGATLVYGGGSVGLMGELSSAATVAGGRVLGVIPQFLDQREQGSGDITSLEVVDTMHTRKARMMELADVIVALPGGIGTFEELFEALTWQQLGLHDSPVCVIDSEGYYSDVFSVLESTVDAGFADLGLLSQLKRFDTVERFVGAWCEGVLG